MSSLRRGDVVQVGQSASVQFASAPFAFQVEDIDHGSAPDGWAWVTGYQLSKQRRPRRRRVILVRPGGLRPIARRQIHQGAASGVGS